MSFSPATVFHTRHPLLGMTLPAEIGIGSGLRLPLGEKIPVRASTPPLRAKV